ncbi:hypothetical protein [Fluviicola chungangensis]|uniref:Cytochrome c domain-containing protein n=1 Tax=Fluviicola chungangensis TaxID=2597671 RepID=A0A556MPK6_9FLAO|nr:hypothetical protein [Fluviicola chungangensis]TSJ41860.1 hypothetical protein FO442_12265 [Fluviicola chungangensis]
MKVQMENHYKAFSFFIVAYLFLLLGCKDEKNCKTVNCGIANLLVDRGVDTIKFGDSLLVRSRLDKLDVFYLYYGTKELGSYVDTKIKSNYTVNISEFSNAIEERNNGLYLFQKNCFACHVQKPLSKDEIINLDKRLLKYKPKVLSVSKSDFFYIEKGNVHWNYYCLDSIEKKILQKYILNL